MEVSPLSLGPWLLLVALLSGCASPEVTRELVFEIPENVPEGTLVGLINGPAPPYLIVGVDSDLSIDQSNGEIRTKTGLDREVRDAYSFVAIPINGENVRVMVHVKDVNDNSPEFATAFMSVEFPENTPRDVKRTLQPAKDRDLGIYNTQRYAISGGNVNNAFRLSSHRERDGVLYLDLQVNGFLDRETTPFYNLVIDAFDGGVPPMKGSMTVHVALKDVNGKPGSLLIPILMQSCSTIQPKAELELEVVEFSQG
jgi:protocadherin-16/23